MTESRTSKKLVSSFTAENEPQYRVVQIREAGQIVVLSYEEIDELRDWLNKELPRADAPAHEQHCNCCTCVSARGCHATPPRERLADEPSAAPIDSRGVVREPFVVKHYEGDTFPTIKGNGFDGLQVGEDRLEAEEFISWINARLSVPPAASRCLGAECHHTLCGTGANSTAPRWPLVEALREIAGYQGTLDTNAELMRKCAQETLDEYFVEYAEEILSEPPQPVTRAIVDLVTELRDAAQIAADGDTYTGSGIAAAKELIARADAFLRTAVTKSVSMEGVPMGDPHPADLTLNGQCPHCGGAPDKPGMIEDDEGLSRCESTWHEHGAAPETSASRCIKCGSSPLATERGRCEDCGARQSTESEG